MESRPQATVNRWDGSVLVVHVEVLGQGLQRQSVDRRQQVGDLADTTVELVHVGEDLDPVAGGEHDRLPHRVACLLYTSDAADEEDSVDLGGRRIIKKKK